MNKLEQAFALADKEAIAILTAPKKGGGDGMELMRVLAGAAVVLAREARKQSLYKTLFIQMGEATTCKCTDWASCQHLYDAFAVHEATKIELEKIEEAERVASGRKKTLKEILTTKTKVNLSAPLIESVVNEEPSGAMCWKVPCVCGRCGI